MRIFLCWAGLVMMWYGIEQPNLHYPREVYALVGAIVGALLVAYVVAGRRREGK